MKRYQDCVAGAGEIYHGALQYLVQDKGGFRLKGQKEEKLEVKQGNSKARPTDSVSGPLVEGNSQPSRKNQGN